MKNNIKKYIAYCWKYNTDHSALLSRNDESFIDFKTRVITIFPFEEGWYLQFSEFNEIW